MLIIGDITIDNFLPHASLVAIFYIRFRRAVRARNIFNDIPEFSLPILSKKVTYRIVVDANSYRTMLHKLQELIFRINYRLRDE